MTQLAKVIMKNELFKMLSRKCPSCSRIKTCELDKNNIDHTGKCLSCEQIEEEVNLNIN